MTSIFRKFPKKQCFTVLGSLLILSMFALFVQNHEKVYYKLENFPTTKISVTGKNLATNDEITSLQTNNPNANLPSNTENPKTLNKSDAYEFNPTTKKEPSEEKPSEISKNQTPSSKNEPLENTEKPENPEPKPEPAIKEESVSAKRSTQKAETQENEKYKPPVSNNDQTLQNSRQEEISESANKFIVNPPKPHDYLQDVKTLLEKEISALCVNCTLHKYLDQNVTGQRPRLQNMIFSTFRSGSSFMGDLISSHPASFYSFEPLIHFGCVQAKGKKVDEGLAIFERLLSCNFTNLESYFKEAMRHTFLQKNRFLWPICKPNSIGPCRYMEFLEEICKMVPFHAIKTTRMRLNYSEQLINNPNLQVKVLLLVRDPRATLVSRKKQKWCKDSEDCIEAIHLCKQLLDDFQAASYLVQKYPQRYMVLRYEDLSLNLESSAKILTKFFGLTWHPWILEFIDTHTKRNEGNSFSTVRDSSDVVFRWKNYFKNRQQELQSIQSQCSSTLKAWGYKEFIPGFMDWSDFHPINDTPPYPAVDPKAINDCF